VQAMRNLIQEEEKLAVARKALEFIQDGMVVGLGSGSTSSKFIELLGELVQRGLRIRGIASSARSAELARSLSIPLTDFHETTEIDVAVDGADEVDERLALIKGGGGALLREKIVASAAKQFIVIIDSSKLVKHLGKFPLPVEVIPMAAPLVDRKLREMKIHPTIRKLPSGAEYKTDEGNLIIDCACGEILHAEELAASIRALIGVVEHGLFLKMAERVIVAKGSEVSMIVRQGR
jgi:ribose 5-phosphate isomerase A